MKQLLIITLSIFICLASCKSKTNDTNDKPATASEYYEKVVDLEESMSEPILTTEAAIKARGDKGDYAGVADAARAMEDTVDIRIKAIENMGSVGLGGDDFKIVAKRYFEYIKSIYTGYKKIGEAKDEKERTKAAEEMTKIINGQQPVMENLKAAQTKYAAANHFTISAQ